MSMNLKAAIKLEAQMVKPGNTEESQRYPKKKQKNKNNFQAPQPTEPLIQYFYISQMHANHYYTQRQMTEIHISFFQPRKKQFQFYPYLRTLVKGGTSKNSTAASRSNILKETRSACSQLMEQQRKSRQQVQKLPHKQQLRIQQQQPANLFGEREKQNTWEVVQEIQQKLSSLNVSNYSQLLSHLPWLVKLLKLVNQSYELWNPDELGAIQKIYKIVSAQNALDPLVYGLLFSQLLHQRDIFNAKSNTGKYIVGEPQVNSYDQIIARFAKEYQRNIRQLSPLQPEARFQEYMGSISELRPIRNCKDIFTRIQQQLERVRLQEKINSTQRQKQLVAKRMFSQQIHRTQQMNVGQLCCTQFFYKDTNIYDENINQTKLVIIETKSQSNSFLQTIFHQSTEIRSQIQKMLNTEPGVLLLSCGRRNHQVHAIGSIIKQAQKSLIIEWITSITQQMNPRPEIGKDIVISFVPVAQWRWEQDMENRFHLITNTYVTRIVVRPLHRNQPLGQAFSEHQVLSNPQQAQKNYYSSVVSNQLDHEVCKLPKPRPIPSTVKLEDEHKSETKYRFVSFLIVKIKHLGVIRERLASFGCRISAPFQSYKLLPFSQAVAVIQHSVALSTLQGLISFQEGFRFNGFDSILLEITDFVKLKREDIEDRILEDMKYWLQYHIERIMGDANCVVYLCKYVDYYEQVSYYFRSEDKIANLLICLLLNSEGQVATFTNPEDMLKAYNIMS